MCIRQDRCATNRIGSPSPAAAHSPIDDYFDLSTAGSKRESSSYEKIAGAIGTLVERILFLSDHPDELDASVAAGWSAVGVHRPGEPNPARPPHRWIGSFAALDLR